ncbi:hypothetical protein AOLI_G00281590 [Acnodon oligacanthus]
MCCCVRAERAVHAPGGAQCSPRSLAHRLRRIGDELEKSWATGAESRDDDDDDPDDQRDKGGAETGGVSVKGGAARLSCTSREGLQQAPVMSESGSEQMGLRIAPVRSVNTC